MDFNLAPLEQQHADIKSEYKSIFKATSLFGGVQVYKILISIIQSKIIAVYLGTSGMGVYGLYLSSIQLVQGFTSFGLSSSAVRDVSEAIGSGNQVKVNTIVTVLRRLVWYTGLFGMVAMIVLAPVISKTTFGNYDYTVPFIYLSAILFLNQLCVGQQVVLQGFRRLQYLAKSSAIGSTIGLLISIPLYYWLGVSGIVPTLVLNACAMLCLTMYFAKKVKTEKIPISTKNTFIEGRVMIKMGITMSVNSILVFGGAYILRWYVRKEGGLDEVGLFTAGFMIMTAYTGLVLNSMATDYYPRLAAVNKDNGKCIKIINQQAEIAILILSPLLIICLVFMPLVVIALYSDKFLGANSYIIWSTLGMLFKAASWAIAHVFIAKGEARLYIYNELTATVYTLLFNVLGYNLYGLEGLGMSFSFSFLIYFLQVFIIAKRRYRFVFYRTFLNVFVQQLLLLVLGFLIVMFLSKNYTYIFGCIIIIVSVITSLFELNKRIAFLVVLKNLINYK